MKTFQPKHNAVKRKWHLIDAKGKVLGRMATDIAKLLMGKHKPSFSKHEDVGDYVIVINSEKIKVTGRKSEQKLYRRHSGYPGGFKEIPFSKMIKEHPRRVIEHAVKGMLPKNRLQTVRLRRLKAIVGDKNPYEDKIKNNE